VTVEDFLEHGLDPLLRFLSRAQTIDERALLAGMEQVVEAAAPVLGVQGVGIILLDEKGAPRVAAASDESAAALEGAQAEVGIGPGMDSLHTGQTVAVTDLWAPGRYAPLRDRLADVRVRSVLSSPIRVGEAVVGNFNAMATEARAWSEGQRRANAAYADVVGLTLRVSAQAADAIDLVNPRRNPRCVRSSAYRSSSGLCRWARSTSSWTARTSGARRSRARSGVSAR
jgi:GAF domain-containing protein